MPPKFYYLDTFGQKYRYQAMQLISRYQSVVQVQERTSYSYDKPRRVYQVVDDALKSATEAQMKTSNEADEKFKKAFDAWPERLPVMLTLPLVHIDTIFNGQEHDVEVFIHKSLIDNSPTSVILWSDNWRSLLRPFEFRYKVPEPNFHFYATLPTSPEDSGTFPGHKRVSVLTDNPDHAGQVFVDTAERKRVFVNVYVLNDTIIFKDVHGRLEGESIVGVAIHCIPNLWCIEESLTSQPARSPNRNGPSLTVTATQITSATGKRIWDWREPIRRMFQSRDVGILFTDKPPSSSTSISSVASGSGPFICRSPQIPGNRPQKPRRRPDRPLFDLLVLKTQRWRDRRVSVIGYQC
ncbi:hypothetical protein BJV77DRAFT_1026808 [Russula vinacea]|nr:hypothetical protein BJV77DRAFT_1026808 [Russula vinacea]